MESRRLCVKVTANPGPARQRHLLVVGKAASVLEQLYREDRFRLRVTHYRWPGTAPASTRAPREARGPCSRRHTKAIAMLYRGIEYSVVQGIVRHHWKWAATVSGTKMSGYGSTRDEAIGNAEKAIERAIQKQRFKQDLGGEDQ
jgi:hypothetical protein